MNEARLKTSVARAKGLSASASVTSRSLASRTVLDAERLDEKEGSKFVVCEEKKMKIKQEGLFIESKYSGFRAENMDQFLGYEAGQFDGASSTFDTIANWIEEDLRLCSFDPERYIEILRRRARDTFSSKVERG